MGKYTRRRVRSSVDDLPPDAKDALDAMLDDTENYWTYQEISDRISLMGCTISKSAIGRYVARRSVEMREMSAMVAQNEALMYFAERNPNYDMANAALALLINRLTNQLAANPEMMADIPADKITTRLIQSIRAAAQIEQLSKSKGKDIDAARETVMAEVREALDGNPELYAQLERMMIETDGDEA